MSLSNGTGTVAGTAHSEQVPDPIFNLRERSISLPESMAGVMEKVHATEKQHRRIAIVGRAPSSMMLAPFGDENWEIWSLSNAAACGQIPDKHWHAWFELHDLEHGWTRWPDQYKQWLSVDHGKPVYIQKPSPLIPHGVVYPWDKVLSEFGPYFNNSVSEMIALALLEGATELALYGVDMAQSDSALHNGNPEYQHQRPSCEFMLGIAQAKLGRSKVYIPPESDLLKCNRVYAFPGVEGEQIRKAIARKKELRERQQQVVLQEKHARDQAAEWRIIAARNEGIIQQAKSQGATKEQLAATQAELEQALQQSRLHKMNAEEAMKGVAKLEGAIEDNDYWMTRLQA